MSIFWLFFIFIGIFWTVMFADMMTFNDDQLLGKYDKI